MLKRIPLFLLLILMFACSANEGATTDEQVGDAESADVVAGELTVTAVEANLTLPTNTGSVWMVIENGTDEDDALTGAAIDGCGTIELHDMIMEDDVMVMRQVEGGEIPVPAGETVELKRGGLHVMCLDKTGEFAEGETVDITLQFANAGTVNVTGTVVLPSGMMIDSSADNHAGELTVTAVEANLTLPTNTGSVWMVIENGTDEDDALTGAAIDGCGTIELHDMIMEDDVMVMRQVEGGEIPVPAGETVELKRGGLHVMCLDKTGGFAEGEAVDITLQFANAGTVNVTGTVVLPTGMMMDHDSTDESDDHHADDDHHGEEHEHDDDAHAAVAIGDAATQLKVAAVTAMMDDAGFHALDEQLNEDGGAITLENAAMVQHVRNALDRTEWPEDLQAQVDELVGVLDDLIPALLAEDMEAAAPLAIEAHEMQHALSNTVASSLEEADHAPDPESELFAVAVTQAVMDSADFHGLDERLNEEDGDIMPLDALLARRVQTAVAETVWPAELSERAGEFEAMLGELAAALDAGSAAELAADTHTFQHDFSAEISEYLGFEDDHH